MCDALNTVRPAPGFGRVSYPGQLEGESRKARRADGIPLEPGLYRELAELGRSVNVCLEGPA